MDYLKLTDEEQEALLNGIDKAQEILAQYKMEGHSLSWDEARSLLRECLGEPIYMVLRNHKAERMLN